MGVLVAVLYPVIAFFLVLTRVPLLAYAAMIAYFFIGLAMMFYGFAGKTKKTNWIILATAFFAIALASMFGVFIQYAYNYYMTLV